MLLFELYNEKNTLAANYIDLAQWVIENTDEQDFTFAFILKSVQKIDVPKSKDKGSVPKFL